MVIDSVETDESHRQEGCATRLMEKALNLAIEHKVDAVELIVNDDNEIAKTLYWNAGFRKTNKEHYRIILNK